MSRTTRLDDALTERISAHVRNGSFLSTAAQRCGVSASAASDWLRMGQGTPPERKRLRAQNPVESDQLDD